MKRDQFLPKKTFNYIFKFLVIFLILIPFITTFDELLTRFFLQFSLYRFIQSLIVPFEIKMVVVILHFFGMEARGSLDSIYVSKGMDPRFFAGYLSWNCIGWQSILLMLLTFFTGLQGSFTFASKAQVIISGLISTFLINVLRISLVFVFAYYFGNLPAIMFHNFAGTIMTIVWLFFFWWFAYSFVLESRNNYT